MRSLQIGLLSSALVAFAGCNRQPTGQVRDNSSPTPQSSTTPETKVPHPSQVAVTLGQTSAEAAPLNPHIAEAYSPDRVTLERTAAAPSGFPGAPEPKEEAPPAGMKWVIVIVDLDAIQGEFSIALNKIRLVDKSQRPYRLVSFGGTQNDTFTDLREYDKYKMVEPPKMIMKSRTASKQSFLFAVGAKAEGLSLEF